MSRALVLPLLASACGAPPSPGVEPARIVDAGPMDEADQEFGVAARGEPVTRTLFLSNDGAGPEELGIGHIEIGANMDGNFTVDWNAGDIVCPDGATSDTTAGAALFTLGAGCGLPLHVEFAPTDLGDIWGALLVESVSDDADEPAYFRDMVHWNRVVYLHGTGIRGQPTIRVSPRSYDFGLVGPGADAAVVPIALSNLGDADLTVAEVAFDASCGAAFSFAAAVAPGTVLLPGASTLAEVAYAPADVAGDNCRIQVTSDDPYNPQVEVLLSGNTGTDEQETPDDGDGDGYAEVNGDCDDEDPLVHPGAAEACDGDDDDCDGWIDEGCVSGDSQPVVIGDVIRRSRDAAEEGDVVALEVKIFDADGQTSAYEWSDDCDSAFDDPTGTAVLWRCSDAGDEGTNRTVYLTALDPDGHQAWAFTKIALYPEGEVQEFERPRMKIASGE